MIEPDVPGLGPSGLVRLVDWGLIRARGDQAAAFLHSQLTQDITQLAAGQSRLAGYCSAKGRLLATFVIWRSAPDEFMLACSADLLQSVLKRLTMFVMRARCKLDDASPEWPLWGMAGASAQQVLGTEPSLPVGGQGAWRGSPLVRLPDAVVEGQVQPRWLLAGEPPAALPPLDIDAWRWLEVHSGVARVLAATAEQFVPQMVNLELVGGVDFQKGCYPGQEIVARSQYRGSIKRRAQVLHGATAMWPGQEVFHDADAGQPAGMVVLAGSLGPARHAGLVELKLGALDGVQLP
ncbi:MAG: folate-binding protein YgfZ, partial [Chitinophagaceae bacterium]|nr:folate-binding protein YgfZ [Rubrivivax sp.]